jgi:hypothetical protein
MDKEYSVEVYKDLEKEFIQLGLHRPMHIERYEIGSELAYDITAVESALKAKVHLTIKKFVGGGFAGQVYQVEITDIESETGFIDNLEVGGVYAMKILIPPSGFSLLFRNLLYWIGFQGPFQLQVNPAAARSGALWQKLIRRGAKIRFGDENAVVDIHATFVDKAWMSSNAGSKVKKLILRNWAPRNTGPNWNLCANSSSSCIRWAPMSLPASMSGQPGRVSRIV